MGVGKYSPTCKDWPSNYEYKYNCYGQIPEPWNIDMRDAGMLYDEKTMFLNYDEDGFDRYGYSAFDKNVNYVFGGGMDRVGLTEDDYVLLYRMELDLDLAQTNEE